jgi:uncharacterized protein (DUF1330 family)
MSATAAAHPHLKEKVLMSYYLIGAITVNDLAKYTPYLEGTAVTQEKFGFEGLAFGSPDLIEGTSPAQRIVLLKFKDKDAFDAWYNSSDYQSLIPIRKKNADTHFLIGMLGV